MRRRIFRCSAVLLMVLLFTGGGRAGIARVNAETGTCGEAGAAACADADARATDSSARRKATPDEAKRDETEDEEWDEWADMVLFDEEATPSSALLADTGCGSVEELCGLLESGAEDIRLSGDIELEPGQSFTIRAEEARQVDMNGYGIVVPGEAMLEISGPILFEGEPGPGGLFRTGGQLMLKNGAEIWAKGSGAVGILCVEQDGQVPEFHGEDAFVRVSGPESVGIDWQSEAEIQVEGIYILAEGAESVGVRCGGDVFLKRCRVTAEGEAVSAAGEIRADLAELVPFPEVTQAIHRKAMGDARLQENGISLEAGSTLEQLRQGLGSGASYIFYDVDRTQASFGQEMAVVWENIPQDISRPGVYTVVCRPAGIPDWLAVELPEFQVPIRVVEPGRPHIQEIFRMEETVAFRYFRQITGAESIRLLCSADDGKTWGDVADMQGCEAIVTSDLASLEGLEMNNRYLFKLSVTGGPMEGESMAVPFSFFEHDADRNGQGDRDGDDRDDKGDQLPGGDGWDGPEDGGAQKPENGGGPNHNGGGSNQESGGEPNQENGGKPNQENGGGPNQESGGKPNQEIGGEPNQENGGKPNQENGGGSNQEIGGVPNRENGGGPEQSGGSGLNGEAGAPGTSTKDSAQAVGAQAALEGGERDRDSVTTVLSKDMLEDQLKANPRSVTLLGDGIRAVIPSEGLKQVELTGNEKFSASLKRLSGNQFEVRFWAGDREITEFAGSKFQVDFRCEELAGGGTTVCKGEDGFTGPVEYREGRAHIRLQNTGVYSVEWEEDEKLPYIKGGMTVTSAAVAMFLIVLY